MLRRLSSTPLLRQLACVRLRQSHSARFLTVPTETFTQSCTPDSRAHDLPSLEQPPNEPMTMDDLFSSDDAADIHSPDSAHLPSHKTEPSVWSSESIPSAWNALYAAYDRVIELDPIRAKELRQHDFVGLAHCTSYAEYVLLMQLFSPSLRSAIKTHADFRPFSVEEFFVHRGQRIEVRGEGWLLTLPPPSEQDLTHLFRAAGRFGDDGRGNVEGTSHRVSVWRGRDGAPLGVTIRVGRFVPNCAAALLPLARKGSVLILSKAGMGKTTLLRDLAASLAHSAGNPRVVVVDTSNEIGGDGPVPLAFLGRCRRYQVPKREEQSGIMIEVLQNHTPEYIVVDELSTMAEAEAAWSISQRGVHLIATCHGENLPSLLRNREMNLLVGGAVQAFLSNEERRLRDKVKKTVLERPHPSPFQYVVELRSRGHAFVYTNVNKAVDIILDDKDAQKDSSVGARVEKLDQVLPQRFERLLRESSQLW